MRKFTLIVLFLFFCLHSVNAQTEIIGILVDKNNGKPVEYATVYINGTSNGIISDSNGNFTLKPENFPCKLVIRHLGYERVVFNLDKGIDLKEIKLCPLIQNINEIQIEAENHREENLQIFSGSVLGKDNWGEKAKILNEDDIKFVRKNIIETKFGKEFTLVAHSEVPIKIYVPLLGYWLDFDLVIFETTPITRSRKGYYYYHAIENLSDRKVKRVVKNREKAYYNSSIHFIRSLYNHCLKEQGYLVFQGKWDKEKREKQFSPIQLDSLLIEADNIKFFKDMADQDFHILYYSNSKGEPIDLMREKSNSLNPAQSGIHLKNDSCTIRKDGTLPDLSISFYGAFGSKQVGASLPADYSPPAKKHQ